MSQDNCINSQENNSNFRVSKLKKPTRFLVWIIILIFILFIVFVGVISYITYQKFISKSLKRISTETEENTLTLSEKGNSEKNISVSEKVVAYKLGNNLILFEPLTKTKVKILSNKNLIDFDLSKDKKFIAYSLKEEGFNNNSDIYLKNLETGNVTRLTPKDNIASFNPKILPGNNKVLYVRREYNPSTGTLSDGEIWIIDSNGNIKTSKKLFSSSEIEGLEAEEDCVSEEEKRSVKIGIYDVSPDGKALFYWKKDWGAECSGLWKYPHFSNLDGSDFFTERFIQQNIFLFDFSGEEKKKFNWEPYKIVWFSDGSFVVGQSAPIPIAGESIYYYDKDQNKQWEIFDSFKQNTGAYEIQVFLDDILKKDPNSFVIVYHTYKESEGAKYFVENIKFGTRINLDNFNDSVFAIDDSKTSNDDILKVKLLDENTLIYEKRLGKSKYGLYLYNITTRVKEKIDESETEIDFDL